MVKTKSHNYKVMAHTPTTTTLIVIPVLPGEHEENDMLPFGVYHRPDLPSGLISNEVIGYLFAENKVLQIDNYTGFVRTWK